MEGRQATGRGRQANIPGKPGHLAAGSRGAHGGAVPLQHGADRHAASRHGHLVRRVGGTRQGTVGAALLAANLALTVPLVLSRPPRLLMMAGAASLVGLPPFGGFPGTLLVAQTAASAGGVWLALLLLGSALVAAAWLNY